MMINAEFSESPGALGETGTVSERMVGRAAGAERLPEIVIGCVCNVNSD